MSRPAECPHDCPTCAVIEHKGAAFDEMTPQEVAEYVVWYSRKVKGSAKNVAAALLEEFPYLRDPLEAAARAEPGASEGLRACDCCGAIEQAWQLAYTDADAPLPSASEDPSMEPRLSTPQPEPLPIDLDGIEMRWASQWNESDDGEVRAWRADIAALIDEVHRLRRVSNGYFEEMVRRTPTSPARAEPGASEGLPPDTKLVLMSDSLMDVMASEGRHVTWEWGEPDEHGWYTPTFTEHDVVAASPSSDTRPDTQEALIRRRWDKE